MKHIEPATHTIVIRHRDGRPYATFTSHDEMDSRRYANAVMAANPDLVAAVQPVERPAVPEGLRAVA